MINFARQGFANPFPSGVGGSFQPGVVGSVARCPICGNAVTVMGAPSTVQPQIGLNPLAVTQQIPYGVSPTTGFGLINPLASQFTAGVTPNINPLAAQLGANWPVLSHFANQGVVRLDPRLAFGSVDPNIAAVLAGSAITSDPISSLMSQQLNPLVNPLVQ